MKDFTKWAVMWDAYAESNPGDPTPGTPAAMCFNIGLIIIAIGGIIGVFIRLVSESDKLVTTSAASFLAGLLGFALLLASLFLPSHNDEVSEPPALSTQIERTWGLDELGDCKNTSHGLTGIPSLPKSSLDDGDWKCVSYTDSQRTELTVHIKGNKVGLYDADGKALK